MHWRRKQQPTPVFLPGESQGRGSLVGCRLWGCTELDTTERLSSSSSSDKESACQCRRCRRLWFDPWVSKMLWRRKWQPAPVFLPGEFHGWRSLAGYSPWCSKESDMTTQNYTVKWIIIKCKVNNQEIMSTISD